jgi:hypothetical protein
LLDLRGTLSFKLYISISQVTLHCHHLVVTSPQNTLNKYSDQGPQQSVSSQYSQGFEQNQTFQYQSNDYCARDNYNSENDGHRDRGRDKNDSYQEKPTYEQSSRTRISRWEHNRNEDSHRAYRSRSPDKARGRAASRDRRERSPITTDGTGMSILSALQPTIIGNLQTIHRHIHLKKVIGLRNKN